MEFGMRSRDRPEGHLFLFAFYFLARCTQRHSQAAQYFWICTENTSSRSHLMMVIEKNSISPHTRFVETFASPPFHFRHGLISRKNRHKLFVTHSSARAYKL